MSWVTSGGAKPGSCWPLENHLRTLLPSVTKIPPSDGWILTAIGLGPIPTVGLKEKSNVPFAAKRANPGLAKPLTLVNLPTTTILPSGWMASFVYGPSACMEKNAESDCPSRSEEHTSELQSR